MKVVLSTTENPMYFPFWEYVAQAYSAMGYEPMLAFLTWRAEDDPIVTHLRQFGTVKLYRPYFLMPEFAQGKLIRFILASEQGNDVCYIDDVDLFPLDKDFIENKIAHRPANTLLCVGGEVYKNNGCYPVSQMTAEGNVWKQFINPNDYDFHNILDWYANMPTMYDEKENPYIQPTPGFSVYFSDEKLIRKLTTLNPVKKVEVQRGYGNILDSTLDRMQWRIDPDKLTAGGYVNAHCQRPPDTNDLQLLLDYVKQRYEQHSQR